MILFPCSFFVLMTQPSLTRCLLTFSNQWHQFMPLKSPVSTFDYCLQLLLSTWLNELVTVKMCYAQ